MQTGQAQRDLRALNIVKLDTAAAQAVVTLRDTHGDCLFVSYLLNAEALALDVVAGAPSLGVAMTCPVNSMLSLLRELQDEDKGSALHGTDDTLTLLPNGDRVPGRVCLRLTDSTTVVLSAVPLVGHRRPLI